MRMFFVLLLSLFSGSIWAASEHIYEAQKKNIKLTDKDKEILEIGEISTTRYVIGGVLGTYPLGLGIGHAIQGRWQEQGQIFTWSQLGSIAAIILGASGCDNNDEWNCSGLEESLIIGGFVSYLGFRVWEAVDVWATPPSHNSKHRKLQKYIEGTKVEPDTKASLDLVPLMHSNQGQGLALRYTF